MNHSTYLAIVIPLLALVYLLTIYLLLGKAQKLSSYGLLKKSSKNSVLESSADLPTTLE